MKHWIKRKNHVLRGIVVLLNDGYFAHLMLL
ncbi:MAG: hypothetical protein ACI8O8_002148, partial [Oleiphilaceae bacterium]